MYFRLISYTGIVRLDRINVPLLLVPETVTVGLLVTKLREHCYYIFKRSKHNKPLALKS